MTPSYLMCTADHRIMQHINNPTLKVLCDLNVAPPFGIEGVDSRARGEEKEGHILYGGLGIGHVKMRIHKAAIMSLFEEDRIMDLEGIYALAKKLV